MRDAIVDFLWMVAAAMTLLMVGLIATRVALAHDYYSNFYGKDGRWCCSGDLEGTFGDCSPALEWQDQKDGSMLVRPTQFPDAWVLVPAHRIMVDGPPDPDAKKFPVHWCGKPRPAGILPTPDDPDGSFITICASRYPGGA